MTVSMAESAAEGSNRKLPGSLYLSVSQSELILNNKIGQMKMRTPNSLLTAQTKWETYKVDILLAPELLAEEKLLSFFYVLV